MTTNHPDIALTLESGNWVKITSQGGRNYSKTLKFLHANAKHMNKVCFGTEVTPMNGSLAIKLDRVERFIAWAAKHGVRAEMVGV